MSGISYLQEGECGMGRQAKEEVEVCDEKLAFEACRKGR